MDVFDSFSKTFGGRKSGTVAKERLQLALIYDRNDVAPEVLDALRADMIEAIKRYIEIDEEGIELDLKREVHSVALIANIPLLNMQRHTRGRKKSAEV